MKSAIRLERAFSLLTVLSIIIWLSILNLRGIKLELSKETLKAIPEAGGYVGLIAMAFIEWGWKFCIFKGWLVKVPNLNGTWKGDLKTVWVDPVTNKSPDPISVFLVIRQTLFSLSCILMTKESKSFSRAAAIVVDSDHDSKILDFTYSNTPRVTVQHRSTAHEGATSLNIITVPSRKLEGKYWTDRNTKGELNLTFLNRKYRQSF